MFISKVVFEGISEVKDTSRESQHKVTWSKKELKPKGLFCLPRGNQERAAWYVLRAESIAVGLLDSRARVILGQGPHMDFQPWHIIGKIEGWLSRQINSNQDPLDQAKINAII